MPIKFPKKSIRIFSSNEKGAGPKLHKLLQEIKEGQQIFLIPQVSPQGGKRVCFLAQKLSAAPEKSASLGYVRRCDVKELVKKTLEQDLFYRDMFIGNFCLYVPGVSLLFYELLSHKKSTKLVIYLKHRNEIVAEVTAQLIPSR